VSASAADAAAFGAGARLSLRQGLAALAQAVWWADGDIVPPGQAHVLDAGKTPSPRSGDRPSPRPGPRPSPRPRRSGGAHAAPGDAETAVLPAIAGSPTGPPNHRPDLDEAEPGDVWAIVRRAQDGDADAFGEIYDRYIDTVFRYIYFRVGSRPLAEDLTSETFLRALRRIGSVTWQGRDLGAWLVTIARNLIADHYKSGKYRLEVATADMLDADQEDHGLDGSPEAAVMERLTNVTLLEAVKKLNPEQQECIVLRFLQGLSVTETAQAMGKNEGAIKALQYRAVRSLGRLLPEGFTP